MGMKKDAYYNRRNTLLDKGLINAVTQNEGPTVYTINNDVLKAWPSVTQNNGSATQNGRSVTQNELSVGPEHKSNTKNNKKTNSKKNNSRVEDAPSSGKPSLSLVKNEVNKERAVEEDSPIDLNVEESLSSSLIGPVEPEPIDKNDQGHSVSQNEDDYYEWNGRMILKVGRGPGLIASVATAPVETKPKCSKCSKQDAFCNGMCWDCYE